MTKCRRSYETVQIKKDSFPFKVEVAFFADLAPTSKVNTPDGNTQFQFRATDLIFRSTDYAWLVVAGYRVLFKGSGTINGGGVYGFMLTAIDESLTSSQNYDSFRIKIWDKITGDLIYDNQLGDSDSADPTTALGGGSIKINR